MHAPSLDISHRRSTGPPRRVNVEACSPGRVYPPGRGRSRLALALALLCAPASLSVAEEKQGKRETPCADIGPVVKAVAEGDVARAAVLARGLAGSLRAISREAREAAELRMLLAENTAGLLPGLTDARAEVRAACAWALGWIRDRASADEVAKLLADAEASVRLEAARALGEIAETRIAEGLERASADVDAGVRAAALESLRKLGTGLEAAVRALEDVRARGDESGEVRHAAARLLGEVRTSDTEMKKRAARALDAAFAEGRQDARWDVRFAAAVALGRLGVADAVPALVRAAADDDERVALAAVAALGEVGGDEAALALTAIAESGRAVATGAVEALGRSGVRSRGVIQALSAVLREGPLEAARVAADALATLGGDAAKEALVEASRSARKEIHGVVAEAAARLDEYLPAAVLLRELDDEDVWTALGAARSLAEIGNAAGFPVFIHALRSGDERVRAFAATCLALHSGARMDLWTDEPTLERDRIARAWRRWWLRSRDTFVVRRAARPRRRGRAR